MNPYQILDVEPTATPEQITKAYRRRAAKIHPDAGGEGEKFLALVKARDILLNPIARDAYDHAGKLPDDTPAVPAVLMIRELAVQCAAKRPGTNLLFSITTELKVKRAEFINAAKEFQGHIDRVERTWEPGDIKTHIVQEFFQRKSELDFHKLTADTALEMLSTAQCNEISSFDTLAQFGRSGSWT